MSKIFGEIRQIAFVVEDVDSAMDFWAATLGIGPFFIKRNITFSNYRYRGNNAKSPLVSIALANSGFVQVELIQQHDDLPSIYKEQIDSGQKGLQHVSSWLTTEELKNRKAELLRLDFVIAQECVIPSSGVQLVYFSTENGPSSFIFEIANLKEPEQYERVMAIKSAHENWDGNEVINEVKT